MRYSFGLLSRGGGVCGVGFREGDTFPKWRLMDAVVHARRLAVPRGDTAVVNELMVCGAKGSRWVGV